MDTERLIGKSVEMIVARLYGQLESSTGKERLAKLRHSIGRTEQVRDYQFLFEMMPEELLGKARLLSEEERAIICSLQLYAFLQQGRSECVHQISEHYQNLGSSLAKIRETGNSEAIDRRFNALILADTGEEFQMHLRYIFRLYKSRIKEGKVDFAGLAGDVYRFIHWENGREEIRLTWSREYYRTAAKGEENHE